VESVLSDIVGPVLELRPVERGYTSAERAVAVLADGRSVFVKQAINPHVTDRLRVEHRMYEHLGAQPFLAELILWRDGGEPILVLEDLSSCVWPPPWNPVRVDAVLSTLLSVTACEPPRDLKPFAETPYAIGNWAEVLAGRADTRQHAQRVRILIRQVCTPPARERHDRQESDHHSHD
jgi:hypothetical protein